MYDDIIKPKWVPTRRDITCIWIFRNDSHPIQLTERGKKLLLGFTPTDEEIKEAWEFLYRTKIGNHTIKRLRGTII